jgi:cell division septation protein DedD
VVHNSSSTFIPDTGIVYCVQLGAFKGEVPTDIATKILQFADKGVKNYYEDDTQLTYYQVGIYGSKDDAETLRKQVQEKGLSDAFIVVWKDGKKVPMSDIH